MVVRKFSGRRRVRRPRPGRGGARVNPSHPAFRKPKGYLLLSKRRLLRQQRRFRAFSMRVPTVQLLVRTVTEIRNDDATHMAAGVAYYAILSLFPLTVGLIALISLAFDTEVANQEVQSFMESYLPGSIETIALGGNIEESVSGALGILSLLGILWTASAVFGAISRAVNRAWDIHQDRPFYVAKARHMFMAMCVGVMLLMSIATTTGLEIIDHVSIPGKEGGMLNHGAAMALAHLIPYVFSQAIFIMIYKYIPNTVTRWRYVWAGSVPAAFLFELGKNLFIYYVENLANYQDTYGSLGSVIALLVWVYFSSFILIAGAELASEYERMREGVAQGTLIHSRYDEGRSSGTFF